MNDPGMNGQFNLTRDKGQMIEVKEPHYQDMQSRYRDDEESKSLIQSKSHSFIDLYNNPNVPHQKIN
jgi:hypothetical protein